MGATAKASLNGVELLASRPVTWALTLGIQPYQTIVECHARDAEKFTSMTTGTSEFIAREKQALAKPKGAASGWIGQTATLLVEGDRKLSVTKAVVVGEAPASNPWCRAFVIADRRWWWRRQHVLRHYNVRRMTGQRYWVGDEPVEIKEQDYSLKYADWSLDPEGKPWTPKSMLEDMLNRVCGEDEWIIEDTGGMASVSEPVDDMIVEADAAQAIARVLGKIPGWDLFCSHDGKIIVMDAREVALAAKMLEADRPLQGSPRIAATDLRAIRPRKIHVKIPRLVELRFDAEKEGDEREVSSVAGANEDVNRTMVNVLPLPEDLTNVPGMGSAQPRGTYVTVKKAMEAWNMSLPPHAKEPLSYELLYKYFLVGSALESMYDPMGVDMPEANWPLRIQALRDHWRRTYQINPRWIARIRRLFPFRLKYYSPLTGVRSPANVFMPWSGRFTSRGTMNTNNPYRPLFFNMYKHKQGEAKGNAQKEPDNMDFRPIAPWSLRIADQAQGIVSIVPARGTHGLYAAMYPGLITPIDKWVDMNPTQWRRYALMVDAHVKGGPGVELDPSFDPTIILTAEPGAPNDETVLHDYEVDPDELYKRYFQKHGRAAQYGTGPEWDLPISRPVSVNIVWKEKHKDFYPTLFGIQDIPADQQPGNLMKEKANAGKSNVPDEIVQNLNAVRAAATSEAAALWANMISHYEGAKTVHWSPNSRPVGNVAIVEHTLEPSGKMVTRWIASSVLHSLSPNSFLRGIYERGWLGFGVTHGGRPATVGD